MKTKIENLKDNKVKVVVSFTKEEVDNAISAKYKELASKYKFPGFRPGKAPRSVVDKTFSQEGVYAQVTDDLVNNNYPLSIDDANIFPVGKADFGKDEAKLVEPGKTYKFSYKIEVEPTYELVNYDEVSISIPPENATEKEIDAQIDQYREHFFNYEPAKATEKVKADSIVDLKVKAKDDKGEQIDVLTKDFGFYHLGSKMLPEDFEKKIVGTKNGDKLKFSIAMPKEGTTYTMSLVDKTKNIDFEVEVEAVQKKVLPKIDDEFAKKNLGFETVSELRNQIKTQIEAEKSRMIPLIKENKCLAVLADRVKDEPPKALVDQKEAQLLQDFFTQLQQSGSTFDAYLQQQNMDADKFKEDLKKQANDVVKQDLALDAYAAHKGIVAKDKEVVDEFKNGDPKNWENLYED